MADTVRCGAAPAGTPGEALPSLRSPDRPPTGEGRAETAGTPGLVVGVGAARGTPAGEILGLVRAALRDAGLAPEDVRELATVDAKAGEPGLVAAARALGVPLVTHPAERLARVAVPHPSARALAAAGTPSVAEAAALVDGGELLVPKRKSAPRGRPAGATCAVVRRGRPAEAGPGPEPHRPPSAGDAPEESSRPAGPGSVDPASVDMMTVVTVGNTATRGNAGRAETPHGIRWQS
ncbi:cobalamin biosynthesis protein [Streptomyces tsukubensis]